MITIPTVSQRNFPKDLLGTSKLSIADYGCAEDCVAVLAGRTDLPTVNDLLVKAGAIVNEQGGTDNASLINWVKVPLALPALKFVWRGWTYDNTRVRDWIYNKKFPVIVEVDAAPIGAPRSNHFVVYLGDQKLFDPWTGRIRATSDFPNPQGYVLYEIIQPRLSDVEFRAKAKELLNSTKVADQIMNELKSLV
jgi:hypothetical protein